MSQNKKIILFIVVPIMVICCLLCVITAVFIPNWISKAFSDDPVNAKATAAKIADYTLPDGYEEAMGIDMFFEQIVVLSTGDESSVVIALIQVNTAGGVSSAQMEQQIRQAFQNQSESDYKGMTYVGTRKVTIKNNPTVLTISENEGKGGRLRQATGTFNGKSGFAMVMVMGPVSDWDWDMLDDFFESIR